MLADAGDQQVEVTLDLKQSGSSFSGDMVSHFGPGKVESGKVSGSDVTCIMKTEVQGQLMDIQMQGKLEGGKLTGTLNAPGLPPISSSKYRSSLP